MFQECSEQALVYQILDEVLAATSAPAGVRGTMFSVLDRMRMANVEQGEVRRAESISIEMHKLQWALQQGDLEAAGTAREALKGLAAELLNARISNRQ